MNTKSNTTTPYEMSLSPTIAKVLIALMWFLVALLFFGSIISLSIPGNTGTPNPPPADATNHNGWWLIQHEGLGNVLRNIPINIMGWWYSPYHGVTTFHEIVAIVSNILIIVVPAFIIIFTLVHIKLVLAVKYPKSIALVDATKRARKAKKKSIRKIKIAERKLSKNKTTIKEVDTLKAYWYQEKIDANSQYEKQIALWKKAKIDKTQVYHFWKKLNISRHNHFKKNEKWFNNDKIRKI